MPDDTISSNDIEIDAFSILDKAPDYDTGINELIKLYNTSAQQDPKKAREVLSTYGKDLYHKFERKPFEITETIDIAPIKPDQNLSNDRVAQINDWEQKNLEALSLSNDPDYIAVKEPLSTSIKNLASEARREELGERGEGVWAWVADKGVRVTQGAIGPFAKLFGFDEVDKDLYERTQRSRDKDISSMLAYGAGATLPIAAVSIGTAGLGTTPATAAVLGTMGAQAAGEAKAVYKKGVEETGNETEALRGAGIVAGAQAIQMLPIGRGVSALTRNLLAKPATEVAEKSINVAIIEALDAQKKTFGNVALSALEAGTMGSAGMVMSNVGLNIALDENGDITEGAADAFLSNAIMAGLLRGGSALLENAAIKQLKKSIKEYEEQSITKESDASTETAAPLFVRNEEGYLVPAPEKPLTVEDRIKEKAYFDKELQRYLNEDEYNGPLPTTEDGEPLVLPNLSDYETDTIPAKTVVMNPEQDLRPNALTIFLAKQLGGILELSRNVVDGAFGAYYSASNKIRVLRSLGADPEKFSRTLAHEIGHFTDSYLTKAFNKSESLKKLATDFGSLKRMVVESASDEGLFPEAVEISKKWRGDYNQVTGDTKQASAYDVYRSAPSEIYADVFSAIVNAPDWVKENYPEMHKAFERDLSKNEYLNSFWNQLQKFANDPTELSKFRWGMRREAKLKQASIEAAVRTNKIKDNTLGAKLKRSMDLAFRTVIDKYPIVRKIIASQSNKEVREAGFDMLRNVKSKDYLYHDIERLYAKPSSEILLKMQQAGIDTNHWGIYRWANRVLNEETDTMARVRENPDIYRPAANYIKDFLLKETSLNKKFKSVKTQILEQYFSDEALSTPEGLERAFASLGIIGDTAELLDQNDFVASYPLDDPQRAKKGLRDYRLAVERLARRKESIPIENLKKEISKIPSEGARLLLEDVTKDNAFAVRKYLINPDGYSAKDASQDIAALKDLLGVEKFGKLQTLDSEFSDVMQNFRNIVEKSGIFSPELISRIVRNKGNYAVANVLKYFEGNDSINSKIRTAIGTLSEVGDEISSTYLKNVAIVKRAYYQNAVNNVIGLANMGGMVVEVTPHKYKSDIFAEQSRLSKNDKDHSYLIGYREGKPSLYKIKGGKQWEDMFKDPDSLPYIGPLLNIVDTLNDAFLTRQLKTVLSPAFVIGQKYYDRGLEAILSNAFDLHFGLPTHLGVTKKGRALKAIDKATRAEIDHYKATGELTGTLKKAIDLNAALLHINTKDIVEKVPSGLSFVDALYESFGKKMPDETNAFEKIGLFTEKVLDKLGGKWLKDIAEYDELRTKVNGFRIGKELLNMTDSQAAVFAQEKFGVPDPLSGGIYATEINKLFLFGRAHLNGLRVMGSLLKDTPKTAASQLALRVVLPKLTLSAPVMYHVVNQVAGSEAADKYVKMLNMIPTNEKASRTVIPLGFQDGAGNYHNFNDVKLSDIQNDWKAWYIRLPQSRELTSVTKVFWPLVSNLFQGNVQEAVTQTTKAAINTGAAGFQPVIQYLSNLAAITIGNNPQDFYRQKGILDKNVVEAGSLGDKFYEYGKYMAASQYPAAVPYSPFKGTSERSDLEKVQKGVPFVGPLARSFIGVSNYGLIEEGIEHDKAREKINAGIVLSTGEKTRELLNEYRSAAAQISVIGKGWQQKVGPNVAQKLQALTSWHAKVWVNYRDELRAALEAGDSERYSYIVNQLEQVSSKFLPTLEGFSSEVLEPKDSEKN